jgi:transcriptional regulator with XRE-family HTH domain
MAVTPMEKPRLAPEAPAVADPGAYAHFAAALRQAMVLHGWSERRLALELGITIGTTQKYFRGKVHPLRVSTQVNQRLAYLLGVTLDALVRFYGTGEYESDLGFEDVVSWVRSSAGSEHMAGILDAISAASRRALAAPGNALPVEPERLEPFTWPLDELAAAGVSEALRERMGLGEQELRGLVEEGIFDDALVEAFSVATNLAEEEVRKAFKLRKPIPPEDR